MDAATEHVRGLARRWRERSRDAELWRLDMLLDGGFNVLGVLL